MPKKKPRIDHIRPEFPPVPGSFDRPYQPVKAEPVEKPEPGKPNRGVLAVSKGKKLLNRILKGETVIGQLLYSILDIVPGGGSLSELLKATIKKAESAGIVKAVDERIEKMKWLRFFLTLTMFIASIYGFIKGVVDLDDLIRVFEALL